VELTLNPSAEVARAVDLRGIEMLQDSLYLRQERAIPPLSTLLPSDRLLCCQSAAKYSLSNVSYRLKRYRAFWLVYLRHRFPPGRLG
jgi:hypothetical protein